MPPYTNTSTQELLFKQIKLRLPSHVSFADSISDVLNISADSAYRRIRGAKELKLEEAKILASRFSISLDQVIDLKTGTFLFSGSLTDDSKKDLAEWLEKIYVVFKQIYDGPNGYLFYPFRDAPFFIFLQIEELAMFQYFFWQRTILNKESLKNEKFTTQTKNDNLIKLGTRIISMYNRTSGTEVWSWESLATMLGQIEYYKESGVFKSKQDVEIIYDKLEELIGHYQKQAEIGMKFDFGKQPSDGAAPFQMYHNEASVWNNCALGQFGDTRKAIVNQSILNVIETTDEKFTQYAYNSIQNLIKKSRLISVVGEKERIQFFSRILGQIRNSRCHSTNGR